MQAKDVREVENPITAIFDLAEDVERQAPKIERLLRYTRLFLYVFLALDFVFIVILSGEKPGFTLLLTVGLWGLLLVQFGARDPMAKAFALAGTLAFAVLAMLSFGKGVMLGVILVSLFYLGMVILDLVHDTRSFFDYYGLRYRIIRAVREADPVILVPQGATPVDRLLTLLGQRSAAVAGMLANRQNVQVPAILAGRSGVAYQFDAFLAWPSGTLAPFGVGPQGSAVYVKAFERPPTRADLEALRRAIEDVTGTIALPPGRVIALWKSDGRTEIPDETYAFLTNEVVRVSLRGRSHACSIELATEMPDGTYDFIPLIVEPTATPTTTPAGTAWGA